MAESLNPLDLITSSTLSLVDQLLTNTINQIRTMRDQGIAGNVIRDTIFSNVADGRGGLEALTSTVKNLTNSLQARYYRDTQNAKQQGKDEDPSTALYMWNATGSNTCPDCISRHGQIKTYDEWRAIGLPGSGTTVCEENCRCTLLSLKQSQKLYGVDNPDDLTKAARQPIKDRLTEIKKLVKLRGENFAESTTLGKLGQFRKTDAALSASARVSPETSDRVKQLDGLVKEFKGTGKLDSISGLSKTQRNALESAVKIRLQRQKQKDQEVVIATRRGAGTPK